LKKILIQSDGKAVGPSSIAEIRSLLTAGWLMKSNMAQYEGDDNWQPLSAMPEFSDEAPASPAEPSSQSELLKTPPESRAPRDFAPILRVAFRVLLLLILVGLVAWGVFYLMRHGRDIIKSAEALLPVPKSEVTNTAPATKIASSKATVPVPVTNAVPTPAQKVRVVQLAVAPTNTALAPWERATQGASNASVSNALSTAVSHRSIVSSLDPKSTPFGTYDVLVINAVQKRWFTLVDQNPGLRQRSGRVVVSFQLFRNGSVANVKVLESSGNDLEEYLCQQAVNDSKPFPAWPANVAVNNDFREVHFTFQY
jgi:TonB family protein